MNYSGPIIRLYCAGEFVTILSMLFACGYIKEKKILFFESLMNILNLLINDNSCIKYQRLYHAKTFLMSLLDSLSLKTPFLPNYVTKAVSAIPIRNSWWCLPLKIAVPQQFIINALKTLTRQSNQVDWNSKMLPMKVNSFVHQYLTFSTSMAYLSVDRQMTWW